MFDLNEVRIVPTARNSINPVPNAVRCGVQEARRASCVPEARYRYTISCVPPARFFPLHSCHPAQQAVRGYQNIVLPARQQQSYNINAL